LAFIHPEVPPQGAVRENAAQDRDDPARSRRARGVEILDGHLMADHVHMRMRAAPKNSFSCVIGFLKKKGADTPGDFEKPACDWKEFLGAWLLRNQTAHSHNRLYVLQG